MIRHLAARLLRRAPPPCPAAPLVAIGDIHGCLGDLEALLARIGDWLEAGPQLVLLGDLVDRGPDSRGVIDRAMRLCTEHPGPAEVLMGNHERMMLDFLDGHDPQGRWLAAGGAATLESFGIAPPPREASADPARIAAEARAAIGAERLDWLAARPLWLISGDVVAVHAAWSVRRPDHRQDPALLLWGDPAFYRHLRRDPPWIVHGHVITRPARARGTRIAVDSGAFRGGGLSAVRLLPGAAPEFRNSLG
ncbi:metallophosphoesterase [Mangrovicoccus algicola]|uniref:Metallophosphoesterase n=1 Tax=Mangrovicoccus algicola TaxID=2771008 RepID=A0A8J6Z8Y3_9RHOB|nr:metallophosphoesterase [Mangrovicoccus algicola]MBE3640149.1 metallophosphoesterase [Mangrovicoccus algicola]